MAVAVVIFVLLALGVVYWTAWHDRAQYQALRYEFDAAGCAMAEPGCSVPAVISNPTDQPLRPQYVDTGGGSLAAPTYNVTIYDKNSVSCHGSFGPDANGAKIPPNSRVLGKLACFGDTPQRMGVAVRVEVYGVSYEP